MSKKLLQDVFDLLPDGLAGYLDTPIPTMQSGVWPISDVDTAIIMQGILAFNINEILRQFEGLHLIQIFMHLAQHNEVLQLLGGTAIQYLWADQDFIIVEPKENVSYAPGENTVSIQIVKGDASNVSCTYYIDGTSGGVIAMAPDESDESLYIGDITYIAGEYEFTFVVTFDGNLRAKQVTITVEEGIG